MGISRELAPGWNRGHEAGARHQSFSARARQIELLPNREGTLSLASHLRRSTQNLSERNIREIDDLSREKNPELALAGFLAFGRRLEEEGQTAAAAEIYAAVGAKDRFDALQGRGHSALRAEVLLKNFTAAASDYRTIVPMIAGSAVYLMARASALSRLAASTRVSWFTRGAGARTVAGIIGLGAEITGFAFANRSLSGPTAGIGEDLGRAALTLGLLKFSGWMGSQIPVPRAATIFLGLMAAHRLEERAGLRPQDVARIPSSMASCDSPHDPP